MGESAEDVGCPSHGVGRRSEDADRRSDRLERTSPTPRTGVPGRGPNLPGRRCKLPGPSEARARRGECLFVLENGAPRPRFALRDHRELFPMTSASMPRSWEVVPRTPRVSPSSGRLRREPSRRGWTRPAKLPAHSPLTSRTGDGVFTSGDTQASPLCARRIRGALLPVAGEVELSPSPATPRTGAFSE